MAYNHRLEETKAVLFWIVVATVAVWLLVQLGQYLFSTDYPAPWVE